MNKFFILKIFFLNLGTFIGLLSSGADKIFWLIEIPLTILFMFFLGEKLDNDTVNIAYNLSLKITFSFSLTISSLIIIIHFNEFQLFILPL